MIKQKSQDKENRNRKSNNNNHSAKKEKKKINIFSSVEIGFLQVAGTITFPNSH